MEKETSEECPYCGATMPRPRYNWSGNRCSVCGEWCTACDIEGTLKWCTCLLAKELFEECPYCKVQIPSPEFSGRGGGRCPICEEWCSAYEINGVTKWYTYPLPWDVYFAAFEGSQGVENVKS